MFCFPYKILALYTKNGVHVVLMLPDNPCTCKCQNGLGCVLSQSPECCDSNCLKKPKIIVATERVYGVLGDFRHYWYIKKSLLLCVHVYMHTVLNLNKLQERAHLLLGYRGQK